MNKYKKTRKKIFCYDKFYTNNPKSLNVKFHFHVYKHYNQFSFKTKTGNVE